MEREAADLLVVNIGELVTATGSVPRGGSSMGAISVLHGVAIAVREGLIVAVGPEAEVRERYEAGEELSAGGKLVSPAFVDGHTHPVFAGTREDEFELRTRGATYVEISEAGGGILSSVKGVRAASKELLLQGFMDQLDQFLEVGTLTVEAKSGYGLTLEDEVKLLEVIRTANQQHPVELVPTFLGAHDFPLEYREKRSEYVELLTNEMLPAIAEQGLAEYCDIFTESHVFDLDQTRVILNRAKDLGFKLRMHVDQLTPLGGAQLAAELGSATADHLEFVSDAGIEAMGLGGVQPVLCPLVPLYLRSEREAPGRLMVDRGLAPALATDFNPGSCYAKSMLEVLTWGALRYNLTAEEAFTAATLNAACSVGRGDRLGTIEVGKEADLLLLDLPNYKHLTYEFGRNPINAAVKRGEIVFEREQSLDPLG